MEQIIDIGGYGNKVRFELEALAHKVRRGDAENTEGHAALRYWRRLGLFARRDRAAADANRPLNYA